MLDAIYSAIGKFLGLLDGAFNSYIVALFIFAIIVELLMLPFGIKQQKNSIKQAKLRPKEVAIRRKYAGRSDQATQQKMSQEIQELYQREGYNPMSGCLPLLIQFPIIIILYNIVINPLLYVVGMPKEAISGIIEFVNANVITDGVGIFEKAIASNSRGTIELINIISENGIAAFEGIKDFVFGESITMSGQEIYTQLASAVEAGLPDFHLFGLNLGYIPSITNPSWLLAIPVLTFVVYFGSMKLTRKFSYQPQMSATDQQQGCSNNIMDITMPLMSVYITFIVPGAIGVYWIFKSLLSTLKQFIMSKVMPLPKFTEEDFKAAEKELKGKKGGEKRAVAKDPNAPRPRSLHYIDADDDEPEVPQKKEKTEKKAVQNEGIASLVDTPELKDDTKNESKSNKSTEDSTAEEKADETDAENENKDNL